MSLIYYPIVDNSPDLLSTARRLYNAGKSDTEIIYALKARNKDAEKMTDSALLNIVRQAKM